MQESAAKKLTALAQAHRRCLNKLDSNNMKKPAMVSNYESCYVQQNEMQYSDSEQVFDLWDPDMFFRAPPSFNFGYTYQLHAPSGTLKLRLTQAGMLPEFLQNDPAVKIIAKVGLAKSTTTHKVCIVRSGKPLKSQRIDFKNCSENTLKNTSLVFTLYFDKGFFRKNKVIAKWTVPLVKCQKNGEIDCWTTQCPIKVCSRYVEEPGDCCPRCIDDIACDNPVQSSGGADLSTFTCNYHGELKRHGDLWHLNKDPCTPCECKAGHICCSFSQGCQMILAKANGFTLAP